MNGLIKTYEGANGCDILVYDDYILHSCPHHKKGEKDNNIINVAAPKFMIKWFRLYKLDFTIRSGRPNIHLKPLDDKNAEMGIFYWSNMECSPFKKVANDNFYDLTPYMKEFHVHKNIYSRIEKDMNEIEKQMSLYGRES